MLKILLIVIFLNSQLSARELQVIYGQDNRVKISKSSIFKEAQGKSVAGMFFKKDYKDGLIKLQSLKEKESLCSDMPFADEPAGAHCTGFLIGPKTLLTAGHCISDFLCSHVLWIFGYTNENVSSDFEFKVAQEHVYECSKILERQVDGQTGVDYSVVELNKEVSSFRTPFSFTNRALSLKAKLYTLGHPEGLPLMSIDEADVLELDNKNFFTTNLDTFHKSSGSPVLNEATGLVEGMLVRGSQDYIYDKSKGCNRINYCDETKKSASCEGEEVLNILEINYLLPKIKSL